MTAPIVPTSTTDPVLFAAADEIAAVLRRFAVGWWYPLARAARRRARTGTIKPAATPAPAPSTRRPLVSALEAARDRVPVKPVDDDEAQS